MFNRNTTKILKDFHTAPARNFHHVRHLGARPVTPARAVDGKADARCPRVRRRDRQGATQGRRQQRSSRALDIEPEGPHGGRGREKVYKTWPRAQALSGSFKEGVLFCTIRSKYSLVMVSLYLVMSF
ncbi:hypothetical protein VTK26DRAFT_3352 [Humicola hyalothermophila]